MISPAFAQTATSPIGGGALDFLIPMVPVFAIFYFLVIRPQQKRMKEHQAMIDSVKRGDTVVTTGGIVGKVVRIGPEGEIRVEIANGVQIQVVKGGISEVRGRGEPVKEIKAEDKAEDKPAPQGKPGKGGKPKAAPPAPSSKPEDDESGKQPTA
jgi:preprotein translocase subunit YajC